MTDGLVQWLREQIATIRLAAEEDKGMPSTWAAAFDAIGYTAALAQCDAHEAILDEHWDVNEGDCSTCVTGHWGYPTHGGSSPQRFPCKTIRILALAYQHRPGYREEWKP